MPVLINCSVCQVEVEVPNRRTNMCSDCSRQKRLDRCKNYKAQNREAVSEYNAEWKSENKEHVSEYNKQYSSENREAIQKRRNIQQKEKRDTDPVYKAENIIKRKFNLFHHGKLDCFEETVGLSLDSFKSWIESQFSSDMDWSNHGTVWQIDHVVPCRWFDFTIASQGSICFHWANMRPLNAIINMTRKGCSLQDLLNQEIKAYKFNRKLAHFEPLFTKFVEKSSDGRS